MIQSFSAEIIIIIAIFNKQYWLLEQEIININDSGNDEMMIVIVKEKCLYKVSK